MKSGEILSRIRELEQRKPSADQDPAGHRRINDEITKLCNRRRAEKRFTGKRNII